MSRHQQPADERRIQVSVLLELRLSAVNIAGCFSAKNRSGKIGARSYKGGTLEVKRNQEKKEPFEPFGIKRFFSGPFSCPATVFSRRRSEFGIPGRGIAMDALYVRW